MALGLKPGYALLNDINPHLVNFYSQVQHGLKVTIEMANDEQLFYAHRDRFNRMIKQGKIQTQLAANIRSDFKPDSLEENIIWPLAFSHIEYLSCQNGER